MGKETAESFRKKLITVYTQSEKIGRESKETSKTHNTIGKKHKLNMELDLQSLFGLHVTWCAQLYSLAETGQPYIRPHLDSFLYEGAIGQSR